ncbi:MAG: hypothetical protein V7459_08600 [Oceanicoccus sp.]
MTVRCFSLIISLLFCQCIYAVDADRLWLPKKYQSIKPKLLQAANEAENTERCVTVIAGEMIVQKNSDTHYYFVITCRDQSARSYNLSYSYPISGTSIDLVAEQLSSLTHDKVEIVVVEDSVVDETIALQLCRNEINTSVDYLDGIEIIERDISPVKKQGSGFSYKIPLFAKSALGSNIRYQAHCVVSEAGGANVKLTLEREGAIAICRDSVRSEAIIYGRISIDEDQITQVDNTAVYRFQLPFEVKSQIGTAINYSSECSVDEHGEANVVVSLVTSGALAICKDSLRTETLLMKSVEINEEASQVISGSNGIFRLDIPFTAKISSGHVRSFRAHCEVDEEGDTYIITEIDSDAVVSVCIDELNNKTRNMKSVTILEEKVSVVRDSDEDLYTIGIPFNAKSPSGGQLKYQAECKIESSGRSRIKLRARLN